MQAYPEPVVGALIFEPEGRLLLLKSHKWRDRYTVPGGHIELGERMTDAVKREVREETGLEVDRIEFLCFQQFVFDDAFWRPRHFIFFDFVCTAGSTEVVLNSEAEGYLWVRPDEATDLQTDPYTRRAILAYLGQANAAECEDG